MEKTIFAPNNPEMLISSKVPCWYVVYTKPRHEKKAQDRLVSQGIEAYVPIQRVLRTWSDRKKWVEEPLLRSYAFVKIIRSEFLKVLQTPGVVCYVYYLGHPASIPDYQIQSLKKIEESKSEVKVVNKKFTPGQTVEVTDGALKGIIGELVTIKGKKSILLRINNFATSVLVEIQAEKLRIIEEKL